MPRFLIGLVVAVAVAVGCGHPPASRPAGTAQSSYDRGMAALDAHDWGTAAKFFVYTRDKFPGTDEAVLAELRLADADLGARRFAAAVDRYREFMDRHPDHDQVASGYVRSQIDAAVTGLSVLQSEH